MSFQIEIHKKQKYKAWTDTKPNEYELIITGVGDDFLMDAFIEKVRNLDLAPSKPNKDQLDVNG